MADLSSRAHLNLAESSRRLFELDPGAEVEAGEGWLFGAGSFDHPTITNAAFRTDDELEPAELIERGREFFGSRGRGFTIWVRDGVDEDAELATACQADGIAEVYATPEMVFDAGSLSDGRREEWASGRSDGVSVRPLASTAEAEDYWRIAASSYAELGFPPEVFGQYTDGERLLGGGVSAFLGELDGEPVAIAMTIVTDGVAGIYWVGSLAQARGRGLGRLVTAAATLAGFERGADVASLQASPMGRPIYEAMGYRTIYEYRLRSCPAPGSATASG